MHLKMCKDFISEIWWWCGPAEPAYSRHEVGLDLWRSFPTYAILQFYYSLTWFYDSTVLWFAVKVLVGDLPVGWPIPPAHYHVRPRIMIAPKNFNFEPTKHIREVKLANLRGRMQHTWQFCAFPFHHMPVLTTRLRLLDTKWGSRKRDRCSALCVFSLVCTRKLWPFSPSRANKISVMYLSGRTVWLEIEEMRFALLPLHNRQKSDSP